MTEHRSLDEFAEATDDSEDDEAAVGTADAVDDDGGMEDDDEGAVDEDEAVGDEDDVRSEDETAVGERVSVAAPATTTSRYEPDGAACAACDAKAVRLWVADDETVCADCKPW